jgi:membrane protein implicated in regulation of membrane protease activity
MVGQRGEAATNFEQGRGTVKLGDTVWLAMQSDETVIVEGDQVVVTGSGQGMLKIALG